MNFYSIDPFNSLLHQTVSSFKEIVLPSLTDQQKKIMVIVSVAFAWLATVYLVSHYFAKKISTSDSDIDATTAEEGEKKIFDLEKKLFELEKKVFELEKKVRETDNTKGSLKRKPSSRYPFGSPSDSKGDGKFSAQYFSALPEGKLSAISAIKDKDSLFQPPIDSPTLVGISKPGNPNLFKGTLANSKVLPVQSTIAPMVTSAVGSVPTGLTIDILPTGTIAPSLSPTSSGSSDSMSPISPIYSATTASGISSLPVGLAPITKPSLFTSTVFSAS